MLKVEKTIICDSCQTEIKEEKCLDNIGGTINGWTICVHFYFDGLPKLANNSVDLGYHICEYCQSNYLQCLLNREERD